MRLVKIIAAAVTAAFLSATASLAQSLEVTIKKSERANAPVAGKIQLYSASKALVIGIDKYTARAWPKLSNAVRDAEAVAAGLKKRGFEVKLLKDLDSDKLDDALKNFFVFDGADKNARLLLWFAGHGHTLDGEGYLVPSNAPSPKQASAFRYRALSLRRFGEYMREAQAKHVLAIFDSCFSGSVFQVARSKPPEAITYATIEPVRQFISSGEAEQEVSDDGTFRKLFLDALDGKERLADANRDGFITGTELGLFLHDKMTNLTRQRQTPRYGKLNALGLDRGDYVFGISRHSLPPTASQQPAAPLSATAQAWAEVKSTRSRAVLDAFRKKYGKNDPVYDALAAERLASLERESDKAVNDLLGNTTVAKYLKPALDAQKKEENNSNNKRVGETFKDCEVCPEMIVMPKGKFLMGSPRKERGRDRHEGPQHEVSITKSIAVGKFEVSFANWDACRAEGGCRHRPSDKGWGRGARPVIDVSWIDVTQQYLPWLQRKTNQNYRLLSEAEWEYAARSNSRSKFHFGNNDSNICLYANGADNSTSLKWRTTSCNDGSGRKTTLVGRYRPNSFGLHDMHGNVWEWVQDCYKSNYREAPVDGSAFVYPACAKRVRRGGSWIDSSWELRAAARLGDFPTVRTDSIGFRVARDLQ